MAKGRRDASAWAASRRHSVEVSNNRQPRPLMKRERMTAFYPYKGQPGTGRGMTAGGHKERYPPSSLSAGFAFRKETITGSRRNGRDAPMIGIGGHLAAPPLPHHRAYGSVPRRFDQVKRGQERRGGEDRDRRNTGCAEPVGRPDVRTCARNRSASRQQPPRGTLAGHAVVVL